MASVSETVLVEIRAWAKRELGIVDDSRIILASRGATPGPHPVAPCLVLEADVISPEGTQFRHYPGGKQRTTVHRAMSLTLTGYGDDAYNWIEALRLAVDRTPSTFTLTPDQAIFDVSEVLSSGIEQVWACGFVARVTISREVAAVEADNTIITINGEP